MKTTRHQAREVALQILYRCDGEAADSTQTINDLTRHFDHFHVPNEIREFTAQLVAGTLREIKELDSLLEKHASNWKLPRMSYVDRNLLRMSIYELKAFPDTPVSVVIDEAIELAKQFGTQESPSFVNGILDAVKVSVRSK